MSDDELLLWAAHFRRRPPSWLLAAMQHDELVRLLVTLTGGKLPAPDAPWWAWQPADERR